MSLPVASSRDVESELHDFAAECYADPLKFILGAWDWPIHGLDGPDTWQREELIRIGQAVADRKFNGQTPVTPIRVAFASGHGVGKTAMIAMICVWLMATRRNAKGVVTANTNTQLQDKTWAAIQSWAQSSIVAHWFEINSTIMFRKGFRASWKCSPQSCAEENSEAFAGQHNIGSTSFYLVDEGSAVPDKIYEVIEGGLTDGEPFELIGGNPTRRTGKLYRVVFGSEGGRWLTRTIDARTSNIANQATLKEWIDDYGEDSDFVRVRVRGLAPKSADSQFIDSERIAAAQKRQVFVLDDEPLVAGCDLAWGGNDKNVIRFRRGMDARSIAPIKIPGELTRDPAILTNRLADVLTREYQGRRLSMLFLDSAGIAGPIGQRLRAMGHSNVIEVNFGADSPDDKCRYFRDYMWQQMKDALLTLAIDVDPQLATDLQSPGIRPDSKQRVWLESKEDMKKRGERSPDDADALALTWAHKVAAKKAIVRAPVRMVASGASGWLS